MKRIASQHVQLLSDIFNDHLQLELLMYPGFVVFGSAISDGTLLSHVLLLIKK